jgi:hemoglobin-like flavoprotein
MSLNVDLLRQSFELVVERAPHLTQRFYAILFERYPATKDMFPAARRGQQENMLTQALVAVMDHLEDAPWLTSTLQGLGARHVHYGVTDEMYAWVGDSLLATLREVADEDWNAELERAWSDAYGAIAGLMQAGARQAAEGPHTLASHRQVEAAPPSA